MRYVLPFVLLAALLGCTPEGVLFQADVPVPGDAWDRSFTPEFGFAVTDTVSQYDLVIDIRHTGDYPFSDLYLFVDMYGPDGRHARDTVECRLADPTGRWYGKGTGFIFAGRTVAARVLYRHGSRFPAAGDYRIRLEQAMRTERLEGVLDVGVSVERGE